MKKQIQAHAAEQQRKNVENAGKIGRKLTDKAEDVIGKIGEFIIEFVKDNTLPLNEVLSSLVERVSLEGKWQQQNL